MMTEVFRRDDIFSRSGTILECILTDSMTGRKFYLKISRSA